MVGNRTKQDMAFLEPASAEVDAWVKSKADQALDHERASWNVLSAAGLGLYSCREN